MIAPADTAVLMDPQVVHLSYWPVLFILTIYDGEVEPGVDMPFLDIFMKEELLADGKVVYFLVADYNGTVSEGELTWIVFCCVIGKNEIAVFDCWSFPFKSVPNRPFHYGTVVCQGMWWQVAPRHGTVRGHASETHTMNYNQRWEA